MLVSPLLRPSPLFVRRIGNMDRHPTPVGQSFRVNSQEHARFSLIQRLKMAVHLEGQREGSVLPRSRYESLIQETSAHWKSFSVGETLDCLYWLARMRQTLDEDVCLPMLRKICGKIIGLQRYETARLLHTMTVMVNRNKLVMNDQAQLELQALRKEILEKTALMLARKHKHYPMGELTLMLCAFAKDYKEAYRPFFEEAAKTVVHFIHKNSDNELELLKSNFLRCSPYMLVAFAQAGMKDQEEFIESLLRLLLSKAPLVPFFQQGFAVHALGVLRYDCEVAKLFLSSVAEEVRRHPDEFSIGSLVRCLKGFSEVGLEESPLLLQRSLQSLVDLPGMDFHVMSDLICLLSQHEIEASAEAKELMVHLERFSQTEMKDFPCCYVVSTLLELLRLRPSLKNLKEFRALRERFLTRLASMARYSSPQDHVKLMRILKVLVEEQGVDWRLEMIIKASMRDLVRQERHYSPQEKVEVLEGYRDLERNLEGREGGDLFWPPWFFPSLELED